MSALWEDPRLLQRLMRRSQQSYYWEIRVVRNVSDSKSKTNVLQIAVGDHTLSAEVIKEFSEDDVSFKMKLLS